MRTRIKICGLTRDQDVIAAVEAGADAIGLVFYAPSPRAVTIEQARRLCALVPPFVTMTALFVNEASAKIAQVLRELPISLLQFHGDETAADCEQFGRPYIKVARMRPGVDLLEYASKFPSAQGLLLDTYVDAYGGSGQAFDWSLIPQQLPARIVMSGGLNPDNVSAAVTAVRPWAVDVSSGVESAKGIKDHARIKAFIAGVKNADG